MVEDSKDAGDGGEGVVKDSEGGGTLLSILIHRL